MGAAFLMATSAIGPGFMTQTAVFTEQLFTSFGFVILVSVLLDAGAQLNIWRIITLREKRAQDLANELLPGLGYFLAAMILFGGLVFNIGNIAGCGLGLQVLTGADTETGAMISCVAVLAVFWYREAIRLVDQLVKWLGLLMIVLTVVIAFASHPPAGEALLHSLWPEKISIMTIVTLVGGTVGGYISFAGAHRLLDAGISGPQQLKRVSKSSVSGIFIAALMRFILFLAALGIVAQGISLGNENPAAMVFRSAAGEAGYLFFGVVLWCAALTSVIGASYTSISFWKTLVGLVQKKEKMFISLFIIVSTVIFVVIGRPVQLLVFAGMVNGMILPVALAVLLLAAHKKNKQTAIRHPAVLHFAGWLIVAIMSVFGFIVIRQSFGSF